MKIRLNSKRSSGETTTPARASRPETGYTLTKVLVGAATLGVVVGSLCVPLSAAFCVVQSTRQNLRATQIVMQKAEALRLFTSSQVCDANHQRKPLFVERDDPRGVTSNPGSAQYTGYLSAAGPAAGDLLNAYRANPRAVTVTLCWTNYNGAQPIVHTREIQTRLARNGTPKYIWGAL